MKISELIRNLSIKRKLQYIFIGSIFLCLTFCLLFLYYYLQSRMTAAAEKKASDNLSTISRNFDSIINNANNTSRLLIVNEAVVSYLKSTQMDSKTYNAARGEIYRILNFFSGKYSVFIFRNDKTYNYTGVGIIEADEDVLFSDKWLGRVSAEKGGYVLITDNDAFRFNTPNDVISFSRVINDTDTQKPIGLIVINIPKEEIEKTYLGITDDKTHFAYFDKDGKIISSDKPEAFDDISLDGEALNIPESKSVFGKKETTSYIECEGGIILATKSTFSVFERDTSFEATLFIAGIAVFVAIIMLLINVYINRSIVYPISKLSESMMQADKGLLKRVSMHDCSNEIGRLKDTYNHMLVQINKLINDLVQEEKNCRTAELNALQEQIKPHFLYNTLDTIAYMSIQNSPNEVYDAIQTLGAFYRRFLSSGNKTIPFSDELDIVRDYIKLQRLRYDDMFEDEYEVDESTYSIRVPKLILQPLVENSIYHGIRPRGEKCKIKISAYVSEN
ncbi:MAG TPA: histidine kinase, partial [Oscillospiraceae bacterium]|nr:histidine kinase [Oscillospiraceae bacterium]